MEIIWGRFVEKTGGQKSRATVPLNNAYTANLWAGNDGKYYFCLSR